MGIECIGGVGITNAFGFIVIERERERERKRKRKRIYGRNDQLRLRR